MSSSRTSERFAPPQEKAVTTFVINCKIKTIPTKNSVVSIILPADDYAQLEMFQETLTKLNIEPFLKFDSMALKCSEELKSTLQIGSVLKATIMLESISRRNYKNYPVWKLVSLDS